MEISKKKFKSREVVKAILLFFFLTLVLASLPQSPFIVPEAKATPLQQAINTSSIVTGVTGAPIQFLEASSYIKLNFTMFTVEFYKGASGYNEIYDKFGNVSVYDDRIVLEYWTGNAWKQRGTPTSIKYVKINDWHYNISRFYTDYLGTTYNITYTIKSDSPIKITISLKSGQTDAYRVAWYPSGIVKTDWIVGDNKIVFGDETINYQWIGFSWIDVYRVFGNITTYTVETVAQGRKANIYFNIGTINVGQTKIIDPSIVAGYTYTIGLEQQNKVFYHNGYPYVIVPVSGAIDYFYFDGSYWNDGGAVWTDANPLGSKVAIWYNGTHVHSAFTNPVVKGTTQYKRGSFNANHTITWTSPVTVYTEGTGNIPNYPSITTVGSRIYVSWVQTADAEVRTSYSDNNGASWSGYVLAEATASYATMVLPKNDTKKSVMVLYSVVSGSYGVMKSAEFDGTTYTGAIQICGATSLMADRTRFSATADTFTQHSISVTWTDSTGRFLNYVWKLSSGTWQWAVPANSLYTMGTSSFAVLSWMKYTNNTHALFPMSGNIANIYRRDYSWQRNTWSAKVYTVETTAYFSTPPRMNSALRAAEPTTQNLLFQYIWEQLGAGYSNIMYGSYSLYVATDVTYTVSSDLLTIVGKTATNPFTLDYIVSADTVWAWEQTFNYSDFFAFYANLQVGNGTTITYFNSTNQVLQMPSYYIFLKQNSHFKVGVKYQGIGINGSFIEANLIKSDFAITSTYFYVYGSTIKTRFDILNSLWSPNMIGEIFDSIFSGSEPCAPSSSQLNMSNVLIQRGLEIGFTSLIEATFMRDLNIRNPNSWGIRTSMTNGNITFYNFTINSVTYQLYNWGDINTFYFRDSTLINSIYVYESSELNIYNQKTFNLQVTNQTGNAISGATVIVKDKFGNTVFSTTTNGNGKITAQTVNYNRLYVAYLFSGTTYTETNYFPLKLNVTKTGYNSYIGNITLPNLRSGAGINLQVALPPYIPPYTPPDLPPIVSFTWTPNYPQADQTVTFDSTGSYDPDGTIISYYWSFGDGQVSTSANPTHSYRRFNLYDVSLTATDDDGFKNTLRQQIKVKSPPNIFVFIDNWNMSSGNFIINATINKPITFWGDVSSKFTNYPSGWQLESGNPEDLSGINTSYWSVTWDFGDGNITTGDYYTWCWTSHAYNATGNYPISFSLTNDLNLTSYSQQIFGEITVVVSNPPVKKVNPVVIPPFKPPTEIAPQPPISLLLIIPIAIAIALIVFSKR
jgi:hypothetical protein